jgi:hypothetical protein
VNKSAKVVLVKSGLFPIWRSFKPYAQWVDRLTFFLALALSARIGSSRCMNEASAQLLS